MNTKITQLVFEITNMCNLNCWFCYNPYTHHIPQDGLDLRDYKSIIRKFAPFGPVDVMGISGGEPFMRGDLCEILRITKTISKGITLLSNGTLINDQTLGSIVEYLDHIQFQIALHGPKRIHDLSVRKSGAFDAMRSGMKYLRQYTDNISVAMVISKRNIHAFEDGIKTAITLGAKHILMLRFNPPVPSLTNYVLDLEEYTYALELLENASTDYGIGVSVGIPNLPCIVDERNYPHIQFPYCSAGWDAFAIDPFGNFKICVHSRNILGNVLSHEIPELVKNAQYHVRDLMPPDPGCKYFAQCRCGCRAVTEIITISDKKDYFLWKHLMGKS